MKMSKKIAIMQPYFFPYIGYYQLINSVDEFVIYDNIQYTKKGWVNRNKILFNNKEYTFTLPIQKDSHTLNIDKRYISENWNSERDKLFTKIKISYSKAPFFFETIKLIEEIFFYENHNLFDFLFNSLIKTCNHLSIDTKITISSNIDIDHNLKGKDKVISICEKLKCSDYINAIGGRNLYNKSEFSEKNINLHFIKSNPIIYKQNNADFFNGLSIIDVLMFNDTESINNHLKNYELI